MNYVILTNIEVLKIVKIIKFCVLLYFYDIVIHVL